MAQRTFARWLPILLAAGCGAPHTDGAAAQSALTLPANLVGDSSFENQAGPGLASPWQGSAAIEANPAVSARGNKDAYIAANSGWNPVQQWITIKPYTHYLASASVQSSTNMPDAYFSVRGGNTWQVLNQVEFSAIGSTAYHPLRFEFDSGSDSSALVYVGMWAAQGSWLRIDDVAIYEAPSVVSNGAFESGTTGWSLSGSGTIDTSAPHSGARALKLSATSGWSAANQWLSVTPNTRYRAGAWVRTSATSIDGYFSVRGSANNVINQVSFGTIANGYQWLTMDFNTGANTSVLLYAGYWAYGTPSFIEMDDISVATDAPLIGNYGFLTDYGCDLTEQQARDRIRNMVALFNITDVQFYDWFADYQTPTLPGGQWTDPYKHERQICQQTIQWYIDELHRDGARAWAYVQSVASETSGLSTPTNGILPLDTVENNDSSQYVIEYTPAGGQPYIAPCYLANTAWADHQVAIWGASVAALGFDGIHWDTPDRKYWSYTQEKAGYQAFLREAAPRVAQLNLMQTLNFVDMNWWDDSLISVIAFPYAEIWSDATTLGTYQDTLKRLPGAWGVLADYEDNNETAQAQLWSCSPAYHLRYLMIGDGTWRVAGPYFPDDAMFPLDAGQIASLKSGAVCVPPPP